MSRIATIKDLEPVMDGCFRIFGGHKETVTSIRVIDDENVHGSFFKMKLFTGSFDHSARCYDAMTGDSLCIYQGHESYILCIKVFQNFVFTGSYDGTVRMWELYNPDAIQTFNLKKGMIQCIEAWESVFITATPDKIIRICSITQGIDSGSVLYELKGHQGTITAMQLVEGPLGGGEEELYTSSQDRTVRVWKHFNGECLRILRFDTAPLVGMHVAENSTLFVAAGDVVYSVDAKTGKSIARYTCRNGAARSICTNLKRNQLFVSSGHVVHIFDMTSCKIIRSLAVPRGLVASVAFNHGVLFFAGDHTVRAVDTNPLIWWSVDGNEKAATAMLLEGEDVEYKSVLGGSPLLAACQYGHANVVETLIHNGADIFATHKYDGESALHKACRTGSLDSVKILLRSKLDPNFSTAPFGFDDRQSADEHSQKARKQSIALHVAAENGHVDIVLELLRWRSDVDWQCEGGLTPLMLAASHGHATCTNALIALSANVQLKTPDQNTALSLTRDRHCRSMIVKALLRIGIRNASRLKLKSRLAGVLNQRLQGENIWYLRGKNLWKCV